MKKWGSTFLILGIGSFILPTMGLQFRILSLLGGAQPIVSVALIIIGAVLLFTGRNL